MISCLVFLGNLNLANGFLVVSARLPHQNPPWLQGVFRVKFQREVEKTNSTAVVHPTVNRASLCSLTNSLVELTCLFFLAKRKHFYHWNWAFLSCSMAEKEAKLVKTKTTQWNQTACSCLLRNIPARQTNGYIYFPRFIC